ncbi:MAG: hypothetical protein NZO16_01055 [Deltaproteobacteria bacterium]|nr:hypothetical protein [Deltaproteobacteria bacterium]
MDLLPRVFVLAIVVISVSCSKSSLTLKEQKLKKESEISKSIVLENDSRRIFVFEVSELPKVDDVPKFLSGKPNGVKLDSNFVCNNSLCLQLEEFSLSAPLELTVLSIDNEPLWLASDNYFVERGLDVPAKNSKHRFLKGVFSEPVIYTEEGFTIASLTNPIKDEKILPLSRDNMIKIVETTRIGDKIYVGF